MTNSQAIIKNMTCKVNAFENEVPHAKSFFDVNQPAMSDDLDVAVAQKRKATECLRDSELKDEMNSDGCGWIKTCDHVVDGSKRVADIIAEPPRRAKESVRLTARGPAGTVLGQFCISLMQIVADLKQVVSSNYDIPVELLQVVGPDEGETMQHGLPLWYYELKNGDSIHCIQLPVPQDFDCVGKCETCGDVRHLFHG